VPTVFFFEVATIQRAAAPSHHGRWNA